MKHDATTLPAGLDWSDDGHASLHGALHAAARRLDDLIQGWARELDATDYRFPTMIAAKDLAPTGYLNSFPHLATQVAGAEQILTPAACYHFYPRLAGQDLGAPTFLTTNCQCHRREDQFLPLQRQWCFQMREIVCIGDDASVARFIAALERKIDRLTDEFGLDTGWQTATDPFYDPENDPKALAQMLDPTKRELCIPGGLAISSINGHRGFFGECYGISIAGETAHSACVAFGIERWLFALAEAHGPDAAAWPIHGAGQ